MFDMFISAFNLTPKQEEFLKYLYKLTLYSKDADVQIPYPKLRKEEIQTKRDIQPLKDMRLIKSVNYKVGEYYTKYAFTKEFCLMFMRFCKENKPDTLIITHKPWSATNKLDIIPQIIEQALALLPSSIAINQHGFYECQKALCENYPDDEKIGLKVIRLNAMAEYDVFNYLNYKVQATGRIGTPAQNMPSIAKTYVLAGYNDLDIDMSHTQFMCALLDMPFNTDWREQRGKGKAKKLYNQSFGRYDNKAPYRSWPWVQPLKDAFRKQVDSGNLPTYNACSIATPDLSDRDKTKQYELYHAFFMQGYEAAFIHHLIVLAKSYEYKPLLHMHDGLITDIKVSAMAIEEASRLIGFNKPVETDQKII
jgi:hypothetical protein